MNSNTKTLKTLVVELNKISSGGPITKIQPKNEVKNKTGRKIKLYAFFKSEPVQPNSESKPNHL